LQPRLRPGFPFAAYRSWALAIAPARRIFRWYFPFSFDGDERVPEGPLVVAANHFSHLDPVIVSLAVGRPIRYLAVDELYGKSWFFDWLTFWLGAIPMTRTGVALSALRLAVAELESGGTVGLYPEGVRVWNWGEVESKAGAAWLANRVGVPLLPVAIVGSDQAMGRGSRRIHRQPIHITVCEPIDPGGYENVANPHRPMMEEWKRRIDAAVSARYRTLAS
jgi:1-acyl-sn-glycerol-3-phosphate acyltransferase